MDRQYRTPLPLSREHERQPRLRDLQLGGVTESRHGSPLGSLRAVLVLQAGHESREGVARFDLRVTPAVGKLADTGPFR
jgi:hypothetical protein